MDSTEKLTRMLNLQKPANRREIPFFPMIITWSATVAGMTQAEIMESGDKWLEAMDICHDLIGKPDVTMMATPADTVFYMGLPAKTPGAELGDNELYQFIEKNAFTREREAEYAYMKEIGFDRWHFEYLMRIQSPPATPEQLGQRFQTAGMNCGRNIGHFLSRGIEPVYHLAADPIFDSLSLIRSMQEFIFDLIDDPGPIIDVINMGTPPAVEADIERVKMFHGSRIGIYAMRSSAAFLSPDMFEEYAWPSLKLRIETYWKAGVTSVLHADSNWLPMLHYFLELPRCSVHFEFDGCTDMYKAYDIIGGWHSMRGDVPSTMLAFGKPDDVSEYCENLITGIGMRGGFMLGSGCEIPLNAKLECVQAMADSLRK